MRKRRAWILAGASAVAVAVLVVQAAPSLGRSGSDPAVPTSTPPPRPHGRTSGSEPRARVVQMKDARLKFEINATDGDGGVQVFIDADSWKQMSIFDPGGRRILTTTTSGRMAKQGGTELFLESGEPPFTELPRRQAARALAGGDVPVPGHGPERRHVRRVCASHPQPARRADARLSARKRRSAGSRQHRRRWEPVAPPNGSPIIGYQVLVVQPDTGLRALPKITLDVMMPPSATSLAIPAGFLTARHRVRVGGARDRAERQPDALLRRVHDGSVKQRGSTQGCSDGGRLKEAAGPARAPRQPSPPARPRPRGGCPARGEAGVRAGGAVLFNAQLWHSGGRNDTDRPRRAIFPYFGHYWIKRMDEFYRRPLPGLHRQARGSARPAAVRAGDRRRLRPRRL